MESEPKLEEDCNCTPWEDYEGKMHSTPWPYCSDCRGTGKRATKFGQELLTFIKSYLGIGNGMR